MEDDKHYRYTISKETRTSSSDEEFSSSRHNTHGQNMEPSAYEPLIRRKIANGSVRVNLRERALLCLQVWLTDI